MGTDSGEGEGIYQRHCQGGIPEQLEEGADGMLRLSP